MEQSKTAPFKFLALTAMSLLVAGCAGSGSHADLQQFMEQAKTQPQGR